MAIHFIKKIWLKEADSKVHSQFTRFSKGIFENRTVINVNKGNAIKLNSTFELTNDLVLFVASLGGKFSVSGLLFARENPEALLSGLGIKSEIKKKKNIFEADIAGDINAEQINKIANAVYLMLFDMHSEGIELKTKKRLPKPGKSGKEKVDDKFCILNMDLKFFPQLHEEFLFDLPENFKKARISHTYKITDIILPKGEKDFEMLRLKAIRKGRISRHVEIDGKIMQEEKDFEA